MVHCNDWLDSKSRPLSDHSLTSLLFPVTNIISSAAKNSENDVFTGLHALINAYIDRIWESSPWNLQTDYFSDHPLIFPFNVFFFQKESNLKGASSHLIPINIWFSEEEENGFHFCALHPWSEEGLSKVWQTYKWLRSEVQWPDPSTKQKWDTRGNHISSFLIKTWFDDYDCSSNEFPWDHAVFWYSTLYDVWA